MASVNERKPFLLRLQPATMDAVKAWATDDLRSVNGQIEYLIRRALRDAGRLPSTTRRDRVNADAEPNPSTPPETRSPHGSRPRAAREAAAPGRVAT